MFLSNWLFMRQIFIISVCFSCNRCFNFSTKIGWEMSHFYPFNNYHKHTVKKSWQIGFLLLILYWVIYNIFLTSRVMSSGVTWYLMTHSELTWTASSSYRSGNLFLRISRIEFFSFMLVQSNCSKAVRYKLYFRILIILSLLDYYYFYYYLIMLLLLIIF